MREVVRGDKHNLRKSANRDAQVSVIHSAHCTDLCLQFEDFSGCVCHLEQLHAQSAFLFPIVFSIHLIPFFDICSVLAVLSRGLFGYVGCFTWAAAQSQQLLFVVLAAGLWKFGVSLRDGTSNLPSSPNPLSNRSVLHEGRKHKTVVFSQPNALCE